MADNVISTGLKLTADASELFDFKKSIEQLNETLTKAQNKLKLTYNADKLLTNSLGQVVQGLSLAQIKAGNYVDELGRVRTYNGGFVEGLTSIQQKLGWYADELGNVYDKLGNFVKKTKEASKAIADNNKTIESFDASKYDFSSFSAKEQPKDSSAGFSDIFANAGQIPALTQSMETLEKALIAISAASTVMSVSSSKSIANAIKQKGTFGSLSVSATSYKKAVDELSKSYAKYTVSTFGAVDAQKTLELSRSYYIADFLKLSKKEIKAIMEDARSQESIAALKKAGIAQANSAAEAIVVQGEAAQALAHANNGVTESELRMASIEAASIVQTETQIKLNNEVSRQRHEQARLAEKFLNASGLERATRKKNVIESQKELKALREKNKEALREYNLLLRGKNLNNGKNIAENKIAAILKLVDVQTRLNEAAEKYNNTVKEQGTVIQKFLQPKASLSKAGKVAGGLGAILIAAWKTINSSVDGYLGKLKQASEEYKELIKEAKNLGYEIKSVSDYRAYKEITGVTNVQRELETLQQDYKDFAAKENSRKLDNFDTTTGYTPWENIKSGFSVALNKGLGGIPKWYANNLKYIAEADQATQRLADKTQSYIDEYKDATSNERTKTLKKINELETLIKANSNLEDKERLNYLLQKARSELTNATIATAKAMWDKQQEIRNTRLDFAGLKNWVESPLEWGSVDVRAYDASIKRFGQALQAGWINQYEYNKAIRDYSKSVQDKFLSDIGLDVSYLDVSKKLNVAGQKLIEARNAGYINENQSSELAKKLKNQYRDSILSMVGYSDSLLDAENEAKKYTEAIKNVEISLNKNDITLKEANYLLGAMGKAFKESILDQIGVEWKSKNSKYLEVLAKLNKALEENLISQQEFDELQRKNLKQAKKELYERLKLNEKSNLFETIPEGETREWNQKQKELNLQIKDLDQSLADGIINQNEYNKAVDTLKNKINMDAAVNLGWNELRDATKRPLTEFEKLHNQLNSFERALQRGEISQKTFDTAKERVTKRLEQESYKLWKSYKDQYRGELGIDSLIDENRSSLSKYQETIYKITGSLNQGYITVQEANMLGNKAYGDLYESLNSGFGNMLSKSVASFESGSESLYQQQIRQRDAYQETMRGSMLNLVNYQKSACADIAYMRKLQQERAEQNYETWGQYL